MAPAAFQSKWASLPISSSTEEFIPSLCALQVASDLARHLAPLGIATVASGGAAPQFKLYVYAQPMLQGGAPGGYVLVELLANAAAGAAALKIKAEEAHAVGPLLGLLKSGLESYAL